jgi:transposase-like protein
MSEEEEVAFDNWEEEAEEVIAQVAEQPTTTEEFKEAEKTEGENE